MTEQTYKREVAIRLFSDELKTAETVERADDEYAPNYVRLPSGHLVNRVFVCGVLIEKEDIGSDSEYWKLIISDPKGTLHAYVGTYQENALAAIENIEVPVFIATVSKIKSNDYNEKTYFQLVPESINVIDEATYDRWIKETEEQTAARMEEGDVSN